MEKTEKVLIPLYENEVGPRFDLTTEVLIALLTGGRVKQQRLVVLDQGSAEGVCRMVMLEDIQTVVCAGIEEEYAQFLAWKGVRVLDGVMGPVDTVLERLASGLLQPGDILYSRESRE